jgi:hypothetical protein
MKCYSCLGQWNTTLSWVARVGPIAVNRPFSSDGHARNRGEQYRSVSALKPSPTFLSSLLSSTHGAVTEIQEVTGHRWAKGERRRRRRGSLRRRARPPLGGRHAFERLLSGALLVHSFEVGAVRTRRPMLASTGTNNGDPGVTSGGEHHQAATTEVHLPPPPGSRRQWCSKVSTRWLGSSAIESPSASSSLTVARASTRTKVVVATAVSVDEQWPSVAIPEDLFPECSDCGYGQQRRVKPLKP